MVDQNGNVALPVAQGWHRDRDHIQPIKQVFAELAVLDGGFQITMGGGDDPDVDLHRFGAAHPVYFPFRQYPQKFHLQGRRHVTNLIQKHGAAVGHLQAANAGVDRAGESAFLVAEQLRLQQLAGNGAAVDWNEGLCGT